MRFSFVTLAVVVLVVLLFQVTHTPQRHTAEAVTCNATELMPCLEAITSSTPPSETCCSKLREQTPCLCGYLEDPTLKPLANNANTAKVASTCGVAYPQC